MNVLSLFDGKSSGYTALELAGIPVTKYYSSEVDKYAIQVSNAIHPNQIRLGDVTKWREWDVDWSSIDLIIAGSPCQGFSRMGLGDAFKDERSGLFFQFLDIVNHCIELSSKVHFMLENTNMAKDVKEIINELLGITPTNINSNLVSGQNRDRVYWASWLPKGILQPSDKKIKLTSILEKKEELPHFVEYKNKSNCLRVGGRGSRLGNRHEWDSVVKLKKGEYISSLHLFEESNKMRLTPRECFRLQTVPEHYIDKILACGVSNTQLYKIAGNGWTDEVIAHIFRGLK